MVNKIQHRSKRHLFIVTLLTCFMFLLVFNTNAAQPVKIGVVQPLTGKYSSYGVSILPGVKFAAEQINAAGGIKSLGGAKIELVIADDQSDVKVCRTQLELLITKEKVSGVIGPFSSSMCKALASLSDQHKVPFISTTSTEAGALGRMLGLRYFRSIAGTSKNIGIAYVGMLEWLGKKHNIKTKKLGLMYPDNTYGKGVAGAVKEELSKKGRSLTIDLPSDWRAADFSPYILKLKAANLDVLIQTGYFKDGVLSHKARYGQDYYPVTIGGIAAFTDDKVWDQVGGGMISKKALGGPVFCCNWFEPTQTYEPYQDMLAKAKASGVKFGGAKGADTMWFSGAAQGIYCFKAAIEKAASRSGETINKALKDLRLEKGSPNLIIPLYDPALEWDEYGYPKNQSFVFVQWVDGKKVPVYPVEYSKMAPRLR